MHANPDDMPVAMETDIFRAHHEEWGGFIAEYAESSASFDPTELFSAALPTGRCESPHWGYLLKGRVRVKYPDHEEVIAAGQIYYVAPGHIQVAEEPTASIEFSPADDYRKTGEHIQRYVAEHPEALEPQEG